MGNGSGSGTSLTVVGGATTVLNVREIDFIGATVVDLGGGTAQVTISASATSITVGSTTVASGTTTRVLYDNAGVLGEYTISGSGNVAMTTSPVFTTPNIGSATGSVTGNAGTATALQNARTIGGVSFDGTANITVASATGGFTVSGGNLTVSAINIVTDTTTGTKFGTATNQKIGFYNATPIVQPTGDVITALQNLGLGASLTVAATTITSRTLWGQTYDGSGNVSGSLTAVGNITGGASSMTITAGTGNSRTLALQSTTSGGTATTFLTGNADQTVTFASGFTAAGASSIGTGNAFTTGTIELGAASDTTLARVSGGVVSIEGVTIATSSNTLAFTNKTITSSTNTLGGVTMGLGSDAVGDIYSATTSNVLSRIAAVAVGQVLISKGTGTLPAWSATATLSNLILTANAITATSNAATIPVTSGRNIVTNNSAATLTITLTTSGAVNMQTTVVQILDFSAVAQTLTLVNTENSATTPPASTNGSTTLPVTLGFMYNSATSKWRLIAYS